jgi:ATP-dependent helicase HrpA
MLLGSLPADFDDIDRQLQSLAIRLERFYVNPGKDRQKEELLLPHLDNLAKLMAKRQELSEEGWAAVLHFRQLVNDYRLTLFSPEIKARQTVSAKKLEEGYRLALAKC